MHTQMLALPVTYANKLDMLYWLGRPEDLVALNWPPKPKQTKSNHQITHRSSQISLLENSSVGYICSGAVTPLKSLHMRSF